MADVKSTALPEATTVEKTDEAVVNASNRTSRITLANLFERLVNVFTHSSFSTTSKTVVGAVNELNTNLIAAQYQSGDSATLSTTLHTAGFVTNGSANVCFVIPITKSLASNVEAVSASGMKLIIRQDGNYTHGSSPTTSVAPGDIIITVTPFGLKAVCIMSATTNAVNNAPCGIAIDSGLKITFS